MHKLRLMSGCYKIYLIFAVFLFWRALGSKKLSTLDLQSAYHPIPVCLDDRKYTAFEACGRLYQFIHLPFGITNGVSAFRRSIDNIVDKAKLSDTFVFVDNVTICGKT